MKGNTFPPSVCPYSYFFLLNRTDISSVPRLLCSLCLFDVCIGDFNGDTWLCFTLVFSRFVCLFFLWDTRAKRGTSLALWCLGNNGGESRRCPVDIWHFIFYWFVPYAALLYAWFLTFIGNIFENLAIVMPSWFKQWYLLFLSCSRRWQWMEAFYSTQQHVDRGWSHWIPVITAVR